ncbi:hypothetical protein [Sandaracinus amylolyticus]|nr:hypothetical protein [Sandaracinus amylolyticus]
MERRGFLTTVALGATGIGTGAVWLPGCGGAPTRPTDLATAHAETLAERLDRGVASVRNAPFARLLGPQPWSLRPDAHARMIRLGLEALVVADVARSIPAGSHLPEPLAQRLDQALPVLDQCVVGYHALLERTPAAVRRNLDRRFRDEPDLAMHVTEVLDERARAIDISSESRLRLRGVARNVGARVRRQSTSALIDDCVGKIENVVGQGGADVRLARSLETHALIDAIWQQVDAAPRSGGASPLGGYEPVEQPPEAPELTVSSAGDPELAVGGVMAGAGLAVFGIGGIVSLAMQSAFPMVVVATPAGVAVIIGLILLTVGAVQNA